MAFLDFLREIDDEVRILTGSDFKIEVTETSVVPNFNDSAITYPNLDTKTQKCKLLESCVLYVDIRNSSQISAEKQPQTLAKMYSAFIRSMLAAARYYGGHVRNIIGDRVMVVFDRERCFTNAVETAVLMNSLARYVVNRRLASVSFRCGIGIDFGKMLVTKAGVVRHAAEKEFYRSLVWMGKPANVASKLTDLANKTDSISEPTVREGFKVGPPLMGNLRWEERTYGEFISRLQRTFSPILRHMDPDFSTFFTSTRFSSTTHPPILFTEAVYKGLRAEAPKDPAIKQGWWSKHAMNVPGYTGAVYGGDVIKTAVKDL